MFFFRLSYFCDVGFKSRALKVLLSATVTRMAVFVDGLLIKLELANFYLVSAI